MGANRVPLYGLVNLGFVASIGVASAIGNLANPRLLYLALLFAICSSPVLFIRRANDRYAVYTIFFGIYFLSFGILDLIALTSGAAAVGADSGPLSPPESLIVLGGIAFAIGYQIFAASRLPSTFAVNDWSTRALVTVGLFLWTAGTCASWYWNIRLTVRAGEFTNHTGQVVTTILMLGRYVQPMGLLIMAYVYTVNRSIIVTLIMVSLAMFQVYLGFVSDTKGGAMLGGIMVIVTGFLVNGKVPKVWALAGLFFLFVAFPIFQAHRLIVVYEHGLSNAKSVDNIANALKLSVDGRKRAEAEHAESFFQRFSVKSSVEMIVNKTGKGVPYQYGHTLVPLALAFIPRLIWPDKLDIQTGVLVNTEFHVTGENVTYISPSFLGEMYWNFGWIGGIGGMMLLGSILGFINRQCDFSTHSSVTRLLVLGISIVQLGLRFEASIATEYAVWSRSIVAILILHVLFSRPGTTRTPMSAEAAPAELNPVIPLVRFPNLLH